MDLQLTIVSLEVPLANGKISEQKDTIFQNLIQNNQ